MGIRTIYLLQCVFLLVLPSMGGKAVLRGPESVVADSTTNLEADPPTIISYSPAPRSYLRTVGSPADAVKMALAAQAAAEKRMVDGAHCKIQWKWTVSKDQQNSTDGSLGVIMVLDEAGRQSDEATTPAFREWTPGATFEDEMEFANCPHAKIQGFRIVFYPYQVPGAGPPEDDDPPTISFSHVEALEESPVLHESWRWTEGAEDREIGKKGPFVASMERYTVAWITD
ncbi:hypothetical protein NGA_0619000 [Nannochloropsis gaditana CCMP526]|uniref:Uncharacterized protein n=1 Tax=Nannochloropsis gaditana TaxID=72520 RepID=W7TXV9_9STRA|nr:hypothetical protein NGA_0619000 [Nannochloropsis gaditana CCMP526]EKU20827.1 hypothetical protein NGA_0619000 [Nannochloropsis gaditana CCMP526]EWM25204.1 hypothetical protein Naga_100311g4 [Nannochloropsis gaditana]EWM25205.1 hypothetical protein Naga_100311g4 [Nannochloropsis gaditana]|eukprot:XP_005855533.1 hypothetical protein NGA_0619000 [Nannochloropsis gaditana CCMP526]